LERYLSISLRPPAESHHRITVTTPNTIVKNSKTAMGASAEENPKPRQVMPSNPSIASAFVGTFQAARLSATPSVMKLAVLIGTLMQTFGGSCGSLKCHRRRGSEESATCSSKFRDGRLSKTGSLKLLHKSWQGFERQVGVFGRAHPMPCAVRPGPCGFSSTWNQRMPPLFWHRREALNSSPRRLKREHQDANLFLHSGATTS